MRMSYPSLGSVLTTFLLVTSLSSVNAAAKHNDVHRHHDQLHHADHVLPAGAGDTLFSDARFDSEGQGTPVTLNNNFQLSS